jgi:hypothetical protein
MNNHKLSLMSVAVSTLSFPTFAAAYIGPGLGLSAIGSLLALLAAIIVAIFGFLWYPIKRIMKKNEKGKQPEDTQT